MDTKNIYWSYNNEEFLFSSLEELMNNYDDLVVGSIVYFGTEVPKHAPQFISAGTIIETMQNAAGEFCEWADDYLCDLPEEAIAELDALLMAWIEKHSKYTTPGWYDIEDAKEYVITTEDTESPTASTEASADQSPQVVNDSLPLVNSITEDGS